VSAAHRAARPDEFCPWGMTHWLSEFRPWGVTHCEEEEDEAD